MAYIKLGLQVLTVLLCDCGGTTLCCGASVALPRYTVLWYRQQHCVVVQAAALCCGAVSSTVLWCRLQHCVVVQAAALCCGTGSSTVLWCRQQHCVVVQAAADWEQLDDDAKVDQRVLNPNSNPN